jgi:multicomponent K+:H+ antiporter subunit G
MIAKVHLHRLRTGAIVEPNSVAGDPPHPGGEDDWATFGAPPPGPAATAADR